MKRHLHNNLTIKNILTAIIFLPDMISLSTTFYHEHALFPIRFSSFFRWMTNTFVQVGSSKNYFILTILHSLILGWMKKFGSVRVHCRGKLELADSCFSPQSYPTNNPILQRTSPSYEQSNPMQMNSILQTHNPTTINTIL